MRTGRIVLWGAIFLIGSGKGIIVEGASRTLAFVSVANEHRIAVCDVDAEKGTLAVRSEIKLNGTPGALCTDPRQKLLYAAVRSAESVAVMRIHADGGELELLQTAEVGINQTYLATDTTGRALWGASYSGGTASVHRLGEDGLVESEDAQVIPTEKNAHSIVADRSGRFVYVPHTGPEAIYQFAWDGAEKKLSPLMNPQIRTPAKTGPRHIKFHPHLATAYTANELGSSTTVYRLDSNGNLEPLQTLTTLPAEFTGENTCAEVKIHPSGKWVYVSNRGDDSLAMYAVDATSGLLTALGQEQTEKTPRSFDLSADGRFAYAAGQDSGKLAVYSIDSGSGKLRRIQTLELGGNLAWVSVVSFN